MAECAFIYVGPNLDPAKDRAVITSEGLNMHVIGCSNYGQAEEAAKELAANGCMMIELCAGFGMEGVARVKKAAGPGAIVGAVRFDLHPAFGFKSGDDLFGA